MIRKFKLGAVDWTVKVKNDKLNDIEAYGQCSYSESNIILQTESRGLKRADTAIDHTIYHEVVHAILDTMSEHDLSNNEKFVQQFALLLHQFEVTKK